MTVDSSISSDVQEVR